MSERRVEDARILIVDDQQPNVRALERLLEQVGYTSIRATTDAREVIGLYHEFQPDLILLDLHMPELDGYTILEQLRTIVSPESYLPVLVLSADITPDAKQRALSLGAKDFLTKPFDATEVLLRMRNLLETRLLHLQLQAQNQQLEERVRERTRELDKAREAALESSQLKSEFLATMSHEFRTPMANIIGWSELLRDLVPDGEQREYIDIVLGSAQDLLKLLNDIVDYAGLEAGDVALRALPFSPRALLEETVGTFIEAAQKKQLALRFAVTPDVPELVQGDPKRITKALRNLIENALKFTEQGEVAVGLIVASKTAEQITLRFAVSDTGIGLSEGARRRLFQPFTQADGSLTRKHGGMGLGLVMARRLVELMGGTIGVDSVDGEGSTFWFALSLEHYARRAD